MVFYHYCYETETFMNCDIVDHLLWYEYEQEWAIPEFCPSLMQPRIALGFMAAVAYA